MGERPGGEAGCSPGGGVTLTLGDTVVLVLMARLPLNTELFLSARLHEEAESDLEVTEVWDTLLEARFPKDVPPLMTVVDPGVGGTSLLSSGGNLET